MFITDLHAHTHSHSYLKPMENIKKAINLLVFGRLEETRKPREAHMQNSGQIATKSLALSKDPN